MTGHDPSTIHEASHIIRKSQLVTPKKRLVNLPRPTRCTSTTGQQIWDPRAFVVSKTQLFREAFDKLVPGISIAIGSWFLTRYGYCLFRGYRCFLWFLLVVSFLLIISAGELRFSPNTTINLSFYRSSSRG